MKITKHMIAGAVVILGLISVIKHGTKEDKIFRYEEDDENEV